MLFPDHLVAVLPLLLCFGPKQLDVVQFYRFAHLDDVPQRIQNLFILVCEIDFNNLCVHVAFNDPHLLSVLNSILNLHPNFELHLDLVIVIR